MHGLLFALSLFNSLFFPVRDLLSPTGENLKTRETPGRGVWVEGLTEHYVGSEVRKKESLVHNKTQI